MSKKENTAPEQQEVQQEAAPAEEVKTEQPAEKTELEKLQDDFAALNDKYLRLMAEYDNFRKRSQREREAIYPEATATAAAAFLPVADNFERALAAECADAEYKKGTELVFQTLKDSFAKLNVETFGEPGDKFDPNCHNAVMHIDDENLGENEICQVFQKGFKLGDKIVRFAMVQVAN